MAGPRRLVKIREAYAVGSRREQDLPREDLARFIHSGAADVAQAFDIIHAFVRLTAASNRREPRAMQGTSAVLAGFAAPGQQVLDDIRRGTVSAGGRPPTWHARNRQADPRALQSPANLALAVAALYKTLGAPPRGLRTCFCRARGLFGEAIRKTKVMRLSGSNDRSAPDGGGPVLSSAAGSRKDALRHRLAEALRANLGRRKEQKRDRMKQAGDAAQDATAQGWSAQSDARTQQD